MKGNRDRSRPTQIPCGRPSQTSTWRVVRFSESSLSRQLEDENEELRKELSNEKMRVAQTEWFATDEVLKKQWE